MMLRQSLFVFFVLLSALLCRAQQASDTTIYFVNIYPGSAIYELEGHSDRKSVV